MLRLYQGALPTSEIYTQFENLSKERNFGAVSIFCGIVREEDGISALSFDIYEPLLRDWFEKWQERAKSLGAYLCMAHSLGDVPCGASSYISAILSSQRKVALSLYADFVEDFKANAPIWKYDIKNGERIYALERSKKLTGSGILC